MSDTFGISSNDVRVNVVLPNQKNFHVVAVSDPVYVKDNIDNNYEKRINQHIDFLNKQQSVLERDKTSLAQEMQALMQKKEVVTYGGERINRLFHTLNGSRQQKSIDLFNQFNSLNKPYMVMDIETFGDSQDRVNPYGVSEVAINQYDAHGNLMKHGYNAVLRQSKEVVDDLQYELDRIKGDKYYYNTLPEYKKRSIVDLMRYSTYKDELDGNAFSTKNGIQHHSIIHSVFDHKDEVDHAKVIQNMDYYMPYMRSGLNTVATKGEAPEEAMKEVRKVMAQHGDKFFLTYNGDNFDMPVINAFANKVGVALPDDVKHLDYLNVIRAAYMDSDDLKRQVNPDYTRGNYGKDKLAAFREILPQQANQNDAHNSTVDTNDTAKVIAVTRGHISTQLESNKALAGDGFNHYPTGMTWNDDSMYHGQQLFANGGVMAYQEGDESFRAKWDADKNQFVAETDGFNKAVINSKSFYQFGGVEDLTGDGPEKKLAFRFYDPDRDEYAYIVRKGEHAFDELRDFVQNRFYNWDNVDGQLKQDITHVTETDRARRRYDRFFSMDGAGRGLNLDENGNVVERGTKGFSGLKRMLTNADIMNQHLESNGQAYRDRVAQYRAEGMSESQAKEKARMVRSSELLDRMNFDSLWDPETNTYAHNQREQDAFFKMYGRLIDEMPYLNQAVNSIDAEFEEEISRAAGIQDFRERQGRFKQINQKRDMALMNYQQQVINQIGVPEKERELKAFENHRLQYFDPEVNDLRSLNFESVGTARNGLYGYAKRGVEEDNPNKARVMRERANNLMQNLHSQNKISKGQLEHYQSILLNNDSMWSATGEIAGHMRDSNGGKYQQMLLEDDMTQNPKMGQLNKAINESFIQKAIRDTNNATLSIKLEAVEGKKIALGQEMRKTLEILDQDRFSRLNSNNYQALEELITSMRQADKGKHISVVMDNANDGNVKVYAYDGKNSAAVQNQLARGKAPSQALEINMPLINQAGTHKVGAMVLNAHSMAVLNGKEVEMISSAQHIARGYGDKMGRIMQLMREGKVEEANTMARRTLRSQIENISGIQRNMEFGENDTYKWAENQSDVLKQSHIKIGNAMVEDFFYNGYDNIKLTEEDFYDPDDVFRTNGNERVLRKGVQLSDVTMDTQHKMLMKMTKWAEEKLGKDNPDFKVFTSSIKADHVSKGVVSTEDIRQLSSYGTFFNHGRDNMVQYMNAFLINDETAEALQGIKGVSRDSLLRTQRQLEYENARERRGLSRNDVSINMKTAYMTQDQLRGRIDDMFKTEQGKGILKDAGLLTKDGELNHIALPRLYEQQGIIASDVSKALTVDSEKRYEKGKQFELSKKLTKNAVVQPGQFLGTRIHDNGYRERVVYEGTKEAVLKAGTQAGEDILLQWQSDPFKLMLDGEKMTDSPVDRKFIQALTGQDDIVAIINPDVAKHKDFGMLMSGEARLLAEHVNGLKGKKKKNAIQAIEGGGIGLKWNDSMGGFMDESFGEDIKRDAFDKVFSQLGVSNTTPVGGYRVGILEAHMSKVSNYSKVVDSSGRRVLGWKEDCTPIHGGPDGVQWGHREMGVLRSQGMEQTYKHTMQIMMENQKQQFEPHDISRLKESRAVAESLRAMTEETPGIRGLDASQFGSLPEVFKNDITYKGTIFDRETVQGLVSKMENSHGVMNQHGFYMELPSVERSDGQLDKVTVRMDNSKKGSPKELDRIFIPFTNVEGANGDIHLRQLQRQIAGIYEKADAVNKAGSMDEARKAHGELQSAVQGYVKQSFSELSSSKGILFGDVFKSAMGGDVNGVKTSSASGLFKLMDFETSQRYGDGQFTVISEQMAKDMGVFDQLKDGKDLYTANVRYPTFHDGAMQFTKLRMDASIKEGEIHTTSFSSMLQNADSDGDYSHIVVMDGKDIQKEWKAQHDRTEQRFQDRWDAHRAKEDPTHPKYQGPNTEGVSLPGTAPDEHITKVIGNSDEEMASKIGKMTIGRASNLNLFMRQIADRFYSDDSEMNYKMKEFGRGLEQKLIDAKHGAEPVGLKMIDHIYAGEWDKAMELDNRFFKKKGDDIGMFQKDYHMGAVAQEMPMALQRVRDGLHTQGLKFGTSTGVNSSQGVQQLVDMLYGNADPKDFGGDSHALEMWHRYLNEEGMSIDRFGHTEASPIQRLTQTPMREKMDVRGGWNTARNFLSDSIGGGVPDLGAKVSQTFESLKGMSGKQKAILGTGLAVAGLAGYNILNTEKPEMHYNNEQTSSPRQEPRPALATGVGGGYSSTQNASIQVQASGRNISGDQLSQAVTQGMGHTGMSAGPTRISVNHQDNTNQLNRQWYRDKVRENI